MNIIFENGNVIETLDSQGSIRGVGSKVLYYLDDKGYLIKYDQKTRNDEILDLSDVDSQGLE